MDAKYRIVARWDDNEMDVAWFVNLIDAEACQDVLQRRAQDMRTGIEYEGRAQDMCTGIEYEVRR